MMIRHPLINSRPTERDGARREYLLERDGHRSNEARSKCAFNWPGTGRDEQWLIKLNVTRTIPYHTKPYQRAGDGDASKKLPKSQRDINQASGPAYLPTCPPHQSCEAGSGSYVFFSGKRWFIQWMDGGSTRAVRIVTAGESLSSLAILATRRVVSCTRTKNR